MRRSRTVLAALSLLFMLGLSSVAQAVKPDEMLTDPALEARARALSEGLRCMVCQNQSIDESDADLARDLRILVRDRLKAGDTDEQVIDYIVSRYGEFVLLKPRLELRTLLLWGAPVLLLLAGGLFVALASRGEKRREGGALTEQERDALETLLNWE